MRRCPRVGTVLLLAWTSALPLTGCADVQESSDDGALVLSQPRVQIGEAEGDSAYLLFGARRALRAGDGRIVVVNTGTNQIRIYDREGRHQRTFGGRGDAPGEFRALQQIGLVPEDSVVAYDIGLGRVSVFSADGTFVRSVNVRPFGNNVLPRALGFTAAGSMLIRTDFDRVFRQGEHRDTVTFALLTPEGVPADTLGRYLGEEVFVLTGSGAAARRTVAFGRDVYASARGHRIVIGTSDAYTFDVFDAAGRKLRSHSGTRPEQRVRPDDVRAADAEWLGGMPAQFRGDIEKRIGEFPHRETYPAYAAITVGTDGSVWVQDYATPGRPERSWTVYDAAGRELRRVRAPADLTITDAGADYVLAWTRDELGVESILLFDLPPTS